MDVEGWLFLAAVDAKSPFEFCVFLKRHPRHEFGFLSTLNSSCHHWVAQPINYRDYLIFERKFHDLIHRNNFKDAHVKPIKRETCIKSAV